MSETTWARYVRRTSDGATGSEIEQRTGIAQSTVSRWFTGGRMPMPAHAAKFAQAYGGNVLEAFVAAGFLTEEEAGVPPRPEVGLHSLVDEDPDLSDRAKAHLKESYELLKGVSTGAAKHVRKSRPRADVVIHGVGATGDVAAIEAKGSPSRRQITELFAGMTREAQAYVLALAAEAEDPEAAEALNEKLVHEHRVEEQWAREARNFMAHVQPQSGDTPSLRNLVFVNMRTLGEVTPFDLQLTDEDHAFLEEIKVGAPSLPKAARRGQSLGRGLRRRQDQEAEQSQDDPQIDTAFGSQVIAVDESTEQPERAGGPRRGDAAPG